ncbi:MAG TPA: hypothetical protein VFO05_11820 [Candidatus Limnocylindrales bacterium]|nr:hypothetical protein [Candidatus Limnocylindrales bacterium]
MTELDIVCTRKANGADWTCSVTIDNDAGTTEHRVGVTAADLARLDPGARDPHVLVDRSFRFLLAREPATSILGSFDLMEIARYFPNYEAEITGFRSS